MVRSTTQFRSSLLRIALWFGSLLIAIVCFTLYLDPHGLNPFIFRITAMFALPAAVLFLPLVIALRDAEHSRIWILLVSGIVIGPSSLLVWFLIVLFTTTKPQPFWQGDPEGLSTFSALIFALIVGTLTTALYVLALKLLHRSARRA